MSPPTGARLITFDSDTGRSSVAGGGFLFPPCLRACSPSGAQSPALSLRSRRPPSDECACPMLRACDFAASYSVAALLARCIPSLFVVGALQPFSSPSGFALPAVARAPPRCNPARRAPIMIRL